MESKSSNILVGAVTIALVVGLFAFVLWLSNNTGAERKQYDILFKQSVSGLAVGSQVQFAGVPAGAVEEIRLLPDTPEFVRVRIAVDEAVPILQGTTATLDSVGFTGVAIIQLDGAIKGAPAIEEPGPYGVPVIPTKPGALGQLLSSAPELLERVSTLTERLGELLNPANQRSISGILANTNRITGSFANRSDEIAATVAEARFAVRELGVAAAKFGDLAGTTNQLLDEEGRPLVADLRQTVQRADRTLAALESAANSAKPAVETINTQTLPEITQLIRDLQEVSGRLGAISAKFDEDPAGALVGGRKLPTYDPDKQN